MARTFSFKFGSPKLNRELIGLLRSSGIKHAVGEKGVIRCSVEVEETVQNELISSIRDKVFSSWQIVSCPSDWTKSYREYMHAHGIPFVEEMTDGDLGFLISRRYHPHTWKIEAPAKTEARLARR